MADLSQIPTDQLMQMLAQHPAVQGAASAGDADSGLNIRSLIAGQPKPQADNALASFARGAGSGFMVNLLDPAVAAVQAAVGDPTNPTSHAANYGDRYHENLAALRSVAQADQAEHPVATIGGEVAGGFALPLGRVATVGQAVKQGVKLGAGYGFGQGVTDDQGVGHIAASTAKGGAVGGVTAGLIGKAGDVLSSAVLPKIQAPAVAAIKKASQAAYKRLEDNGVQVSPDALNAMGDSLADKFGSKLVPELASNYPKAFGVFNLLSRYGTEGDLGNVPATFGHLDQIRQAVADATQSIDPADKRMARQVLDHFDDFVGKLKPEDMDTTALDAARADVMAATGQKGKIARDIADIEANKSGALAARGAAGAGTRERYMQLRQGLGEAETARQNALANFTDANQQVATGPQQAISDLNEARDLWSRYAKASQLQGIMDKAKSNSTLYNASGYENALRTGFRKLMNNDRALARFSPEEQDAIKQVATGGSAVSATNLLRQVGKLSPAGAIPLLSEIAMVGAAGPGALAMPAAGLAGRLGATVLQKKAAQRAVSLAAMGPRNAAALSAVQLPVSLPRLQAARAAQLLPRLGSLSLPALLPAVSN